MKFTCFEEIIIWKKAKILTNKIYKMFYSVKDYSFKEQIQRAAISIMNNIAEGYERKGNKEFKQFLFIAKGSCGELRSMLYIALDLKYIKIQEYSKLLNQCVEISKMLSGLIKTL